MNGCLWPKEKMQTCSMCNAGVHLHCLIAWKKRNKLAKEETSVGLVCMLHHHSFDRANKSVDSEDRVSEAASVSEANESKVVKGSCDWIKPNASVCAFSCLPLKTCGYDGCNKPVHNVCQREWEFTNKVELEGGRLRCRGHHPNFNNLLGGSDGKVAAAKPPPKRKPLFTIDPTAPDTPNCNNLNAPSDRGIAGAADNLPQEFPPLPTLPPTLPPASPTIAGQERLTTNTPAYRNVFKYIGERLPGRLIGASPLFGSSPADSTVTGLTDANVLDAAAAGAALDASALTAGGDDIVGGGDDGDLGVIQNDRDEANEVEFVHQPNPYYDEEESLDNSF